MTEQVFQHGEFTVKVGLFEQRVCKSEGCNAVLKRGNRSGYCRSCYAKKFQVPLMRERKQLIGRGVTNVPPKIMIVEGQKYFFVGEKSSQR